MAVGVLTAIFFILVGALWHQHPGPNLWLFGSLFLGILWAVGFMRLITRDRR
jgi:hypothetical protein